MWAWRMRISYRAGVGKRTTNLPELSSHFEADVYHLFGPFGAKVSCLGRKKFLMKLNSFFSRLNTHTHTHTHTHTKKKNPVRRKYNSFSNACFWDCLGPGEPRQLPPVSRLWKLPRGQTLCRGHVTFSWNGHGEEGCGLPEKSGLENMGLRLRDVSRGPCFGPQDTAVYPGNYTFLPLTTVSFCSLSLCSFLFLSNPPASSMGSLVSRSVGSRQGLWCLSWLRALTSSYSRRRKSISWVKDSALASRSDLRM